MTVYHAQVSRDGKYWLVHVPEIGKYTQARNLGEVDAMARDLIAIMTDQEPDRFDLAIEWPSSNS